MYGKFFASAFTGSMMGAGPEVFAVWAYVIAHTHGSQVELNPKLLSALIGTSPEAIQGAIDYLCAPDPNSRSKVEDGKRLVREGEFAYRVPNYEAYRAVRDEDDRRAYNRQKQAESRARRRVNVRVIDRQSRLPMSANTEAETETKTKKRGGPKAAWVVEMCEVWKETYGGTPNWGAIARTCQALAASVEPLELISHWQNYLRATPARYATVKRFVETYGSWSQPGGARANGHVSEDEAATAFRLAGLDLSQTKVRDGGYENRAALEKAIEIRKSAVRRS